MKKNTFEGASTTGNFQEALNSAIAAAKEKLHTDLIIWELEKMSGEDGGYVEVHNLTVTIHAHPPGNEK